MAFLHTFVTFCLFLSGSSLVAAARLRARQGDPFASIPPSRSLFWTPCYTTNFSCALLDVPLDYSKPSGSRAYLAFLKYAAAPTAALPYKGAILYNPGGPGESGVQGLLADGALSQSFIGANYDIIGFDPRGIGASIPLANCSASIASSTAPLDRRYVDQLHGPYFNPQFFMEEYQYGQTLGKQCQSTIGGADAVGPYMNSAVVARDMISFLDAYATSTYSAGVTEPELLNFWGFSYGTFIGQVFANMFPDRVGRVILDAVVDAAANVKGNQAQSTYADEAFSTFFVYCHLAGASQCPYYTGRTSEDILDRFEVMINKLDSVYAQLRGWANATVIELTLEAVKDYSRQCASFPIPLAAFPYFSFPSLAQFLLDVEAILPDLTMAAYQRLETNYELNVPGTPLEWDLGVSCTDNANIYYGRSLLSLIPGIILGEAQSYISGEYSGIPIYCSGWSIAGKGIYTGPFGGATKNPLLFISNTRDPITALQSGQNGARIYDRAEFLLVDGTGHTSASLFNNCAFGKVSTFFQTGTLSASESFCPQEAGPWGVVATSAELNKRGLDEITKRVQGLIRSSEAQA